MKPSRPPPRPPSRRGGSPQSIREPERLLRLISALAAASAARAEPSVSTAPSPRRHCSAGEPLPARPPPPRSRLPRGRAGRLRAGRVLSPAFPPGAGAVGGRALRSPRGPGRAGPPSRNEPPPPRLASRGRACPAPRTEVWPDGRRGGGGRRAGERAGWGGAGRGEAAAGPISGTRGQPASREELPAGRRRAGERGRGGRSGGVRSRETLAGLLRRLLRAPFRPRR